MHSADLSRVGADAKADDNCKLASLLCEELPAWDALRRSFADPVMLNDDRVLENLLATEDWCLPNANYFDFQLEIKPFMRRILTSWMLEVTGKGCCRIDMQTHSCCSPDMELGHWITGSMGHLGHLSRPSHRVIILTHCETRVFRFLKKKPNIKI